MPYKDPNKQREAVEDWQANNSEHVKAKKAAWYQQNKSKRVAKNRDWRRDRYAQDASAMLSSLKNLTEEDKDK